MKRILIPILFLLTACSSAQRSVDVSFESALLRLQDSVCEADVTVTDARVSNELGELIAYDGSLQGTLVTPDDFTSKLQSYAKKRLTTNNSQVHLELTDVSCGFAYDLFRPVSHGSISVNVTVKHGDEVVFAQSVTHIPKDTFFLAGEKIASSLLEALFVGLLDQLLADSSFIQALDA